MIGHIEGRRPRNDEEVIEAARRLRDVERLERDLAFRPASLETRSGVRRLVDEARADFKRLTDGN